MRMNNECISSERDHDGGELNESKITASEFIIASGDSTILFEFLEKTLHQVTFLVEKLVVFPRVFGIGLGRDAVRSACLGDEVPDFLGTICLVTQHCRSLQWHVG